MSGLQKVQVFSLGLPPKGTPTAKRRCRVKWRIDGRDRTRAFKTRAEADRYRRQLLDTVEAGEAFDDLDGEPASWSAASMTWLTWTQRWIELKWPHWAGTTRRTAVETLAAITPRMVKATAPAPPAEIVDWLRADGYIPGSDGWADVPAWLDRWSIPLDEITPHLLERVLTEITTRQDGKAMTAAVSRRRRNTLGAVLRAAVKRDLLVSNPLDKAEWRTPERDMTIDVATVPSIADVLTIVDHVAALDTDAARYSVLFACVGLAGLRPSEAIGLVATDLDLPSSGRAPVGRRRWKTDVGTPVSSDGSRMLTSFEPHPGGTPSERHFVLESQPASRQRQAHREQPAQGLTTLQTTSAAPPPTQTGTEERRTRQCHVGGILMPWHESE